MELMFRRTKFDTENDDDMKKLQEVLDIIDVRERVKAKQELAALFKSKASTHARTD